MAIRRTLAQFSDEIVAADIAADAVGASELANNAVDTAAIATGAVTATELSSTALASVEHVKPHIQPGVLQPAVAGKLLNGTTHSGAYGTAQTQSGGDGHSYYYTDIKGSKPIKDPRIGAHFGSQRYTTRSIQKLEQETATHGNNVYSVDGREWIRVVDAGGDGWVVKNDNNGNYLQANNSVDEYIEIIGYFNSVNISAVTATNRATDMDTFIDGVANVANLSTYKTTVASPLLNRYLDGGSLSNLGLTGLTTPAIHTLKITIDDDGDGNDRIEFLAIELIAQDTTSTATKSQIQIPSQNVVSYGKKFTVSGTPHYNPFATKGDGSASTIPNNTTGDSVATGWAGSTSAYWESTLDTATSLGLTAWEEGGAFYRPVNGGRVVKWVDSTGTIKTSVNMMPPSAKAVGSHSGDATPTGATNWSTQYLPIFSTGAVDHSQAEVAKTFNWREFGNGNANKGMSGAVQEHGSINTADASMLTTTRDAIAYVMDDGLTSLSGADVRYESGFSIGPYSGTSYYMTFIGTGISITCKMNSDTSIPIHVHVAQNLPYGTHIMKVTRDSSGPESSTVIDGVTVRNNIDDSQWDFGHFQEATYYQPKMPPIPENAVVLADYMLMADFVPQTAAGASYISKGTRRQNISRDVFFDETDGDSFNLAFANHATADSNFLLNLSGNADSPTSMTMRIPSFGTNYVHRGYQSDSRSVLYIDTTDNDSSATKDNTATYGSYAHLTSDLTLGVYKFGSNAADNENGVTQSFDIATPIHTSSHYQTFETPFLHELVGGDRNMEQTNLVVTADGKAWDEVTRDVSYIGSTKLFATTDTATTWSTYAIMDEWRAQSGITGQNFMNKDFAIAYDRVICLVDGFYKVYVMTRMIGGGDCQLWYNGAEFVALSSDSTPNRTQNVTGDIQLKRGDYLQVRGEFGSGDYYWNNFQINRLK